MSSNRHQWKKRFEERLREQLKKPGWINEIVREVREVEKLPLVFVVAPRPTVRKPIEGPRPPELIGIGFVEETPEPIELQFDLAPKRYESTNPESLADDLSKLLIDREAMAAVESLRQAAGHTVPRSQSAITENDIMKAWYQLTNSGYGPDRLLLNPGDIFALRSLAGIIRPIGTYPMPKGNALVFEKDEVVGKRKLSVDLSEEDLLTLKDWFACVPTDRKAIALVT